MNVGEPSWLSAPCLERISKVYLNASMPFGEQVD